MTRDENSRRTKKRSPSTLASTRLPLKRTQALLIVAASEGDANMLYATGFFAPDPFIFFQHRKKKYVIMSDLEIDRAKKDAEVEHVLSLSFYLKRLKKRDKPNSGIVDVIEMALRERGVRSVYVPANFPALVMDGLRARGLSLRIKNDPFFPERELKTDVEVRMIRDSLRVSELGLDAGIEALKKAKIGRDRYLYANGRRLTSEAIKAIVNTRIMAEGWLPSHTIVSSGNQCCDPHHEGSGPLKAHTSIIFDIFPRSQKTGYFGDLSRTVVRGRASDRLKEAYAAVQQGQELAYGVVRDGIDGKEVHERILALFKKRGFPTGKIAGRMQGFFHGTGHGLGLDIHEPPRIAGVPSTLRAGHVVTVEPGLYYLGIGGVRLEDVIVVTKKGNRNLTRYPKFLEI